MTFDKVIKLTQSELKEALVKELKAHKYSPVVEDGFIYAEGTVPVMMVAHMDTVHRNPVSCICKSSTGVWMAPEGIGGDDRCGIYSILQIIRHYNISVLFTEDEERGCIGAGKFTKHDIKPDVQFIIELDRKGADDCVFYQCDNKDFAKFIESFGFKTAYGSCSDISKVAPHINRAAVNLSCGYYNPHTEHEFIVLDDMWNTIRRVENILSSELTTTYEYVEKKSTTYKYSGGYSYDYDYPDYDAPKQHEKWFSTKEYAYTDPAVENIIWTFGMTDWFWKHWGSDELHSCVDTCLGVDSFGRFWLWKENGKIVNEAGVVILDANGFSIYGFSAYSKLLNLGGEEYTIKAMFQDIEDDVDTGDDSTSLVVIEGGKAK